jgi:hypothetical protein
MSGLQKCMTERDELANLEAERDRLRSLIALYERPDIGFPELPAWFGHVLLGIAGLAALAVAAGMLAGQIDASLVIFAVVFLSLTAYISTRKINAFGKSMRVFDLLGYLTLTTLPGPRAPELRQRLSNCESRIVELRNAPQEPYQESHYEPHS